MRTLKLVGKTAIISLLALIAFVGIIVCWSFAIRTIAGFIGISEDWVDVPLFALVIFLVIVAPKSWFKFNFPIIFKSTAIIDAPIETVWDHLAPRARNDYYLPIMRRIEADPHDPNQFTMHIDDYVSSSISGKAQSVMIEVKRADRHSYIDYIYHHTNDTINDIKCVTRSERCLEQTPSGVRVTMIEHTFGISLFMWIMFMIGNPCKDALKKLRSVCEGTPDTSWAGMMAKKINVEKNGGPKASLTGDILVMSATAVAVWTAVTLMVIWYVLRLSASG